MEAGDATAADALIRALEVSQREQAQRTLSPPCEAWALHIKSDEGDPYKAAERRQIVAPGVRPGFLANRNIGPGGATVQVLRPAALSLVVFNPG